MPRRRSRASTTCPRSCWYRCSRWRGGCAGAEPARWNAASWRSRAAVAELVGRLRRPVGGIAARLHLTPKTVEAHIRGVFGRLGLDDGPDDHRRALAVLSYLRGTS